MLTCIVKNSTVNYSSVRKWTWWKVVIFLFTIGVISGSRVESFNFRLTQLIFSVVVIGFITIIISCLGIFIYEKRRKKNQIFENDMKNLAASPDKLSIKVCSACAIKTRVHDLLAWNFEFRISVLCNAHSIRFGLGSTLRLSWSLFSQLRIFAWSLTKMDSRKATLSPVPFTVNWELQMCSTNPRIFSSL